MQRGASFAGVEVEPEKKTKTKKHLQQYSRCRSRGRSLRAAPRHWGWCKQRLSCQYLYFCNPKASKLSTWARALRMLSRAPHARPRTPAPALFSFALFCFPSLCLPLARAARRRQQRCAALLPRRGTQFTCFTSTKVQILAAVMCGAVAAPASVFELLC